MYGLTVIQRDLLYLIDGSDEPYGLSLKRELERYHESVLNHGRFYVNLERLIENGFVDQRQSNGRTDTYVLTERGKETLKRRRDWETQHVESVKG